MPNCRQCKTKLSIKHPWNSGGDILLCLVPFCAFERRPQGWIPNPQNREIFVACDEVLGTNGRRNMVKAHVGTSKSPGYAVTRLSDQIKKRPKYCYGRRLKEAE